MSTKSVKLAVDICERLVGTRYTNKLQEYTTQYPASHNEDKHKAILAEIDRLIAVRDAYYKDKDKYHGDKIQVRIDLLTKSAATLKRNINKLG